MDFIERLFNVSPDGGDGSTELIYLAALMLILVALSWWQISRRASSKR